MTIDQKCARLSELAGEFTRLANDIASAVGAKTSASPYLSEGINISRRIVCDDAGLPFEKLDAKGRERSAVEPRHLAIYLCSQLTRNTDEVIAKAFGGRDRTVVSYVKKRYRSLMETEPVFARKVQALAEKAKDAIDNHEPPLLRGSSQ